MRRAALQSKFTRGHQLVLGECKCWEDRAKIEEQRCKLAKEENYKLKEKLKVCMKSCEDVEAALELTKEMQREVIIGDTLVTMALRAELRGKHNHQLLGSMVFDFLDSKADARLTMLDSIYLETCVRLPDLDVDQVNVLRENEEDKTAMLEV
ncbi:unnamed protein product [Phytophthora lilii]|uniref:Unnamed protein product n=1 Tax=Phytophthora lilii TaxID=2077276 RepID=A0A9W6X2A7_9STRA|nr:unnamed protein product [Phytophthora lilii]